MYNMTAISAAGCLLAAAVALLSPASARTDESEHGVGNSPRTNRSGSNGAVIAFGNGAPELSAELDSGISRLLGAELGWGAFHGAIYNVVLQNQKASPKLERQAVPIVRRCGSFRVHIRTLPSAWMPVEEPETGLSRLIRPAHGGVYWDEFTSSMVVKIDWVLQRSS